MVNKLVGKRDKMWSHGIFLNGVLANLKTSQSKLLQICHFCKDGGFVAGCYGYEWNAMAGLLLSKMVIKVLTFYKIEKT